MLIALLLAVAAPVEEPDPNLSPAVRAVLAERPTLSDAAFIAKVQALADADDPSAIELMGEVTQFGGFGLVRDPAKACALFARAAGRRGDAAHNLARCYEAGEGLGADPAQARSWYRRAAALGYPKSDCALGLLMIGGKGGPRDVDGGVALCRRSADAGDADAQTDLADMFLSGKAVKKDMAQALRYYTLAAEQKQPNAALILGQIYWNGDGVPVSRDIAVRWWKVAWDGGRKEAAGLIARALLNRGATTRDGRNVFDTSLVPETTVWLERAAADEPDPDQRKVFADLLVEFQKMK